MAFVDPYGTQPVEPEPTWGDVYDTLVQSFYGSVAAPLAAAGRVGAYDTGRIADQKLAEQALTGAPVGLTDATSRSVDWANWQDYFQSKRDATLGGMTEAGRQSLQSDLGSEEFWKRPITWTLLQATNSTPASAAAVAPLVFLGGPAGYAGAFASGGGLGAGSVYQDISEAIDSRSDEELYAKIPAFKQMIDAGKDPFQAREDLITLGSDQAALLAFLSEGVGAVAGPEAVLGRLGGRLVGTSVGSRFGGGVIANALKEGGTGLVSEAITEGTTQYAQEQARVNLGLQTGVDWNRIAQASKTGAYLGAIIGLPGGAVGGIGHRGTAKPSTEPPPPSIRDDTEPFAKKSAIPETTPPLGDTGLYGESTVGPAAPPVPHAGLYGDLGPSAPQFTPMAGLYGEISALPDALSPSADQMAALRAQGPTGGMPPPSPQGPPPRPTPVTPPLTGPAGAPDPNAPGAIPEYSNVPPGRGPGGWQPTPMPGTTLDPNAPAPPVQLPPVDPNAPRGPEDMGMVPITPPQGAIPVGPEYRPADLPAELPFDIWSAPPEPEVTPPVAPPTPAAPAGPRVPAFVHPRFPGDLSRVKVSAQDGNRIAQTAVQMKMAGQPQVSIDQYIREELVRISGQEPTPETVKRINGTLSLKPTQYTVTTLSDILQQEPIRPSKKRPSKAEAALTVAKGRATAKRVARESNIPYVPYDKTIESMAAADMLLDEKGNVINPEDIEGAPEPRGEPYASGERILEPKYLKTEEAQQKLGKQRVGEPTRELKEAAVRRLKGGRKVGGPGLVTAGRIHQQMGTRAKETARENKAAIEEREAQQRYERQFTEHYGTRPTFKPEYTGKVAASERQALRDADERAQRLLKRAPSKIRDFTTPEGRKKLFDRLTHALNVMEANKHTVPEVVTEKLPDALSYMVTVKELVRAEREGKATDKHIQTFLVNEAHARAGDFAALREERKAAKPELSYEEEKTTTGMATEPSPEDILIAREEAEPETSGEVTAGTPEGFVEPEGPAYTAGKPQTAFEAAFAKARRRKAEKAGDKGTVPIKEPPKHPPKVQSVIDKQKEQVAKAKEKLKEAVQKVDDTATEAQKETNARGAVLYDYGLPYHMAYKPGETRNGVTLPPGIGYGHIKRTRGADGKQLDVWFGPLFGQVDDVYVIDQKDLTTGKFDETKSMVGFKNEQDAVRWYNKAFADGRGAERIMDVTRMGGKEHARWVRNPKKNKLPAGDPTPKEIIGITKRGRNWYVTTGSMWSRSRVSTQAAPSKFDDTSKVGAKVAGQSFPTRQQALDAAEKLVAADPANRTLHPALVKSKTILGMAGQRSGIPGDLFGGFDTVQEYLDYINSVPTLAGDFDFDHLVQNSNISEPAKQAYTALWNQIVNSASDTPIHVISRYQFDNEFAPDTGMEAAYHKQSDIVIVPREGLEPTTLLHELVHSAFAKAMLREPKLRFLMTKIAQEYAEATNSTTYEMTSADEFVAEVFANLAVQNRLAQIPASWELKKWMRDRRGKGILAKAMSLWDVLRDTVLSAFNANVDESLFDAVMHAGSILQRYAPARSSERRFTNANLTEQDIQDAELRQQFAADYPYITRHSGTLEQAGLTPRMRNVLTENEDALDQYGKPLRVRWRGTDSLAQLAKQGGERFGKGARRVANAMERTRVASLEIAKEAGPFLTKLTNLAKKYDGQQWEEFERFRLNASVAQLNPAKPLDAQAKDNAKNAWRRAQYPELKSAYDALPADLKDIYQQSLNFFSDKQNEVQQLQLHNILQFEGIDNTDLAKRLMEGNETEEDIAALGEPLYDRIQDTHELVKLNAYTPQMRFGKYVAYGDYEIKSPASAIRQLTDDEGQSMPVWEFDSEQAAANFSKAQKSFSRLYSVFVDDAGNRINGKTKGAIPRWRVSVQNRHVEFFDTEREANLAAAALAKDGLKVLYAGVRRDDTATGQSELLSHQMQRMVKGLQNRPGYMNLSPPQRAEVMRALLDQSIRLLGSTRIQSRRLPRHNVLGASKDFVRTSIAYNKSMAGYLAKLRHTPELNDAIKEMDASVRDTDYGKVKWNFRQTISNELIRRASSSATQDPRQGRFFNAVASVAFLRYLASPAYTMIQLLQPQMLTLPRLASRFGASRAARTMMRVYADIRADKILLGGGIETLRQLAGRDQGHFFQTVLPRLSARERSAMEELYKLGIFGIDAGLEFEAATNGNTLEKVTEYGNNVARAMPRAAETINRFVSALAAYRLELERSGNHDTAVQFAQEVTNATQGLYSHTDAPDMFKGKWFKLPLLFRRYASLVYDHLALNAGLAFGRGVDPAMRKEAMKTLAYTAISHATMAGAMGLTGFDPLKFTLIVAHALGVPYSMNDWENDQRRFYKYLFGQQLGEIVAHGLPRAIGIDLSNRVGLTDMLLPPGEPNTNDQQSAWAYVGEMMGGAPGAMVVDQYYGLNSAMHGDIGEAAQKIVPIKAVQDSIRAWRQYHEGKKSAAGYVTVDPYSLTEAFTRSLGLAPAREAEQQEFRSYFYTKSAEEEQDRNDLLHDYINAKPSERFRVFRRAQEWGRNQPPERRLTMKDLEAYRKRREKEDVQRGIRITKTNRSLFRGAEPLYNLR